MAHVRQVARAVVCALLFITMGTAVGARAQERAPRHELPELIVSATRTEKRPIDVPASVEILGADAIRRAAPINVDELFKTVVGVDLQGSGFPGSEVKLNLRGLTPGFQSKRVLVLVDGRRINEQFQGNVDFALLSADNVERIEIVRGPASALYGSNAQGGVINIVTRKGGEEPDGRVRFLAGGDATYHVRAGASGRAGRFDYAAEGSHVETDGYGKNGDGTARDWEAGNLAGNVGWALSRETSLRFHFGAYEAEGTDENSDRDVDRDHQSLQLEREWGEGGSRLEVLVYRNAEDSHYDWKFPGEGVYRQETFGGHAQCTRRTGPRHRWTGGAELRRDDVNADDVQGKIDEHDTTAGLYLQDEVRLGRAWELTVGVRYDNNEDYDDETSPRFGVLWRVSDEAECYASVNRAHRAPALSDRFVRTEFGGSLFEGNPDLDPETLTAYEIGARQRWGTDVALSLAAFFNDLEDSFDFIEGEDGVFRPRNVSEARTLGIEASLNWRITRRLTSFFNYAFTDGEYETFPADREVEGNRLAYLAEHKASAGLSFEAGRWGGHSVTCRYVDDRYGDAQNSASRAMAEHVVFDWRSRVPLSGGIEAILNIDNLLDEHYEDFPGRAAPGATFLAGVEAVF